MMTDLSDAQDPPSKKAALAAALKLFVRDGYGSVTIRQIAAESGYSNPALFKFFSSKERLAVHVFERTYSVLLDELGPYFERRGPLEAVLQSWVDSYFLLLERDLESFLFVHDHLVLFWPKASKRVKSRDLFGLMRAWLEDGRRRGTIFAGDPLEVQSAAVGGFFHQLAKMKYMGKIPAGNESELKAGALAVLTRILAPKSSKG